MKRSKRLLVLVVILAVVSGATLILTKYEEKQEEIKNSDAVILEISSDTVASVSWENTDGSLSFYKEEDKWLYEEDADFPVSEEKVMDMLSHFENFGVSFVIENVEDYGQYGLDNPEGVISLATSDTSYEIKLGDFSKMDEQRYVDIGDGNVYLVSDDPMEYLETELSEMILNDEIPSFETIKEIQFEGTENYSINYEEEANHTYSTDDVYFTKKSGKTLALDTDIITDYLNTIALLNLSDYASYHVDKEELETYGMNEPELTISIAYTYTEEDSEKEDTFVLYISSNPEEQKAAEETEDDENVPDVSRYVRVGDSQIVYNLSETSYEKLMAVSYDDLRHKEVFWADFDDVTQIDVCLEEENHTLTSEEGDDGRIWYYGEEEIDVLDLQSAVESLYAESFSSESPEQKEEISLILYLDNDEFPQVSLTLYRYDGNTCLAVVDGESVSLVSRSVVVELIEAVQTIVLD